MLDVLNVPPPRVLALLSRVQLPALTALLRQHFEGTEFCVIMNRPQLCSKSPRTAQAWVYFVEDMSPSLAARLLQVRGYTHVVHASSPSSLLSLSKVRSWREA